MSISFHCDCGKKLAAKDSFAGRRLKCPGCGKSMTIPKPRALPTQLAGAAAGGQTLLASQDFVHFACACGRKMRARPDDIGLEIDCPRCGTEMTIPAADGKPVAVSANGGAHKSEAKKQNGQAAFSAPAVGTMGDGRVAGPLVRFACQCGRKMKARQADCGAAIDCPSCGREMTIPEPDAEPAPVFGHHHEPAPLPVMQEVDEVSWSDPAPALPPDEPLAGHSGPEPDSLSALLGHDSIAPVSDDEPVTFLPDPEPVSLVSEEEPVTFVSEPDPVTSIPEEEPVTFLGERDPVTTIPEPAPVTAKAFAAVAPALPEVVDTLVAQHSTPWRDEETRRQSGNAPPERSVRSRWLLPTAALIAVSVIVVEWYLVQETRGNPRKGQASIGTLALVPAKAIAMTTFRPADILGDGGRADDGVKALVKGYLKEKGFDQLWMMHDLARFTSVLMQPDPTRAPRKPENPGGAKGGQAKGKAPAPAASTDEFFIVETRAPYDQQDVILRFLGPVHSCSRTHVGKRGYWKSVSWDVDKAVCFVDAHTFVLGSLASVHHFVHEQNTEGTDSPPLDAANAALLHDFVSAVNLTKQTPFAKGATPPALKAFRSAQLTADDLKGAPELLWTVRLVFENPAAAERAANELHHDFIKSMEQAGSKVDVVLQTTGRPSPEAMALLDNVLGIVNRNSRLQPR